MKKQSFYILALLLIFLGAGCSPANAPGPSGSGSMRPILSGLNRDQLANYSATTDIHFQGAHPWVYQLKTRKSLQLLEESLHIEGVDKASNPGDVRLVTDGKTTWMIGPGTDNECVLFPNHQGMDPTFLYPETLVPVQDLNNLLGYMGDEPLLGSTSEHYGRSGITVGKWKDAQVGVWQDKNSQVIFRFTLRGSGDDSVFNTGAGTIDVNYAITDLSPVTIQPVEGCQIDVPLPDKVLKLIRLPGVVSYEIASGRDELTNFYQNALPPQKWAEKDPPAQSNASTILSYSRDTEVIEIHIEDVTGGGSKVKILWLSR